ncbi:transposase [Salmonella enterica subsp. houtenae]|nr:Tn3 family transposase [Salmonella enterica]ECH8776594.1 hypothetical protein [Salmonella enterica subsp. houtenae]EDU8772454.1 transposase [Salmonella enterica subsp. houtenae]EDV9972931.1 transposase [Salmonella enterica subsp. houtenae]
MPFPSIFYGSQINYFHFSIINKIGRSDKTIQALAYLTSEHKRRDMLQQLNRGELRQSHRTGQKDECGLSDFSRHPRLFIGQFRASR